MKDILKRLICIALALSLALALGACGKDEDADGVSAEQMAEEKGPDPTEDPKGFLEYNMKNTAAELSRRYEGSPLTALSGLKADSGTLSLSASEEGKDGALTASISYDTAAKNMRLDAALTSEAMSLSAAAYLDQDFLGISSPELLGDDAFYGFVPSGLSAQADGSAVSQFLGDDFMDTLAVIDEALEQMKNAPVPDREDMENRCEQLSDAILAAADLTVESTASTAVERDGETREGVVLTAAMDGGGMQAVLDKFQELFPEFQQAMEAAGEDADLHDLVSPDVKCEAQFVTDGCLVKINFSFTDVDGSSGNIVLNFFDQGGESLTIAGPGSTMTVKSAPGSDESGWSHVLTADDGEITATVTTEYKDGVLSVLFSSPEESGGITCALEFTDTGFTAKDLNITSDNMTQYIPVTLTFTAGTSVVKPGNTKNVFELSQEELLKLLAAVGSMMQL